MYHILYLAQFPNHMVIHVHQFDLIYLLNKLFDHRKDLKR
ncbi:unnamed protein product [Schistosoma margrebowiei]|uniref:Uncharacterized protein n=1 Tax=Schistosoma margrebowiei TaxID=48269 RepID=A0A183LB85_9TREM|nr:unnamed protein product [Schistosoma margrebowiei]